MKRTWGFDFLRGYSKTFVRSVNGYFTDGFGGVFFGFFLGFFLGIFLGIFPVSTSYAEVFPYADAFYPRGGYSNSNGRSSPLISLNFDEKENLNSAFRIAARENRLSDLKDLLQRGVDVNSKSDQGETALIYASRNCATEIVSFLLKSNADPNLRDSLGRSPLMFAVMEGCLKTTRILLKDPKTRKDFKDDMKKTAADYADEGALLEMDGDPVELAHLFHNRR